MAKKQVIIQRFDGGISDDIRQQTENSFSISQHFDIFSPNKLKPYRDHEDDGVVDTQGVRNFLYYNSKLYGYGNKSNVSELAKIFEKSDPTAGSWTASTTAESSSGARNTRCFVQYKGFLYGWAGANNLWRYEVASNTFSDTYQTIAFTRVAQGIVGLKDDILYLPYDNKIATLNNTSFTTAALTLPSTDIITQITEYGNYIAVATRPTNVADKSKVYLWDRTSSDVSEIIDWGEGDLYALGNIEGRLVGVSNIGGASAFGINPSITIKIYAGGTPQLLKSIYDTSITVVTNSSGFVSGDRFYFMVTSTNYNGIFVVGRVNQNYPFVVTLDRKFLNDTSVSGLQNFIKLGDYFFIAYGADGSERVVKTNDGNTFTGTSILETQKYNFGDLNKKKRLVGVAVSTTPMPTAGQIVIKYKVDAESSFTTISTNTTDNSVSREDLSIVSTGKNLPEFYEIQFRIESTGGAEITGLKFVVDDSPKNLLSTK